MLIFIKVGGNHHFKAVAPKLFCQLHADGVGGFRGGLPRREGLVAVKGQDAVLFLILPLSAAHLPAGGGRVAVEAGHKELFFGFDILLGIIQHLAQALKVGTGKIGVFGFSGLAA